MTIHTRFHSPEHEAAFRESSLPYRRGNPHAQICGARLRTGAACPNPPLREGAGRCLSHAGPKAANEHHERLHQGFMSGRVSAETWNRAEARRAKNRLGDQWKKNSWLPGTTIDLGGHEDAFRAAIGGTDIDALPPAVVDWLRWRYRRTQIDARNDGAWHKALTQGLPKRVAKAGLRPTDMSKYLKAQGAAPRTWIADSEDDHAAYSKRNMPDKPRAPKVKRGKGYARRGRPRTQPAADDEYGELMEVYRVHRDVLAPIMEVTLGEARQLAVLRSLRDYMARPQDANAVQQWIDIVTQVQVR
ncbi:MULTISPECIES: hypothetical protein [unclassified Falsihalocynthiibacter]|uniref:hypothetical protein n=1 Tax=unclassified Falsihalocynthiibacter TaxID=2854191 RepID=UPI00350EF796